MEGKRFYHEVVLAPSFHETCNTPFPLFRRAILAMVDVEPQRRSSSMLTLATFSFSLSSF